MIMTELQMARRTMNAIREDLIRCREYRSHYMAKRNQANSKSEARDYMLIANQYSSFVAQYKKGLKIAADHVADLLKRSKS